jgi:16S rRNA (cytidine1402-2'-O)-methyltransferase
MHFQIKTPTVSLHEHNEKERSANLIERLLSSQEQCAAIVTDAGTPCISDPGAFFVSEAHNAGVHIVSIPGPSALTSALAASGFLQPRQIFSAFLPRQKKEQFHEFNVWQHAAPCVAVFYESPQRIAATLQNLICHFGESLSLCLSREISKLHEEHQRGTPTKILDWLHTHKESLGEIAVCVNIPTELKKESTQKLSMERAVLAVLEMREKGFRIKDSVKEVAEKNELDAKALYSLVHKHNSEN